MTEMYLEITELFFIIGGFLSLVLGILLWFSPDTVAKMSMGGNKWYSSRKRTKPLDVMRETDSFYFRHHLAFGVIMSLASILAIYLIITRFPSADSAAASLGGDGSAIILGVLLDALRYILLAFIIMGTPMWVLLAVAPQTLIKVNATLNTWISTRMLILPLETMNTGFDAYVVKNHRIFSILFSLGALFILFKFLGS